MARQYTPLDPIDGSLDFLSPVGQRKYVTLQNVHAKGGHLRRRPALVTVGPSSTPGTAGNVRLITEYQHGIDPIEWVFTPAADDSFNQWAPSAGTDHYAMIDESPPDDATTYLRFTGTYPGGLTELFGPPVPVGITTVESVTWHFRVMGSNTGGSSGIIPITYTAAYGNRTPGSVVVYFDGVWTTTSKTADVDPRTGLPWDISDIATYEFGWYATGYSSAWTIDVSQFYVTILGTGAASRPVSKIVISNTEFLRLEEDLASFTDIDDGLASTATSTEPWDSCEFDNLIWFTNNTDNFFKYPDAGTLIDQNATNLVGKTIATFMKRLFTGNVLEGGTRERSKIRWSVTNDGDDFAGAGSGSIYADSTTGEIMKLKPMAEKANSYIGVLVVYKDTSIYHIYPTGVAADPIDIRLMDGSVGTVGTNAVTNYVNDRATEVHAFVGRRNGELNVFEWDGNTTTPIGDTIKDYLNENYNPAAVGNTVVNFDPNTSLLWVGVPLGTDSFPTTYHVYDIIRRTWKTATFAETMTALGQFKIASAPTLIGGKNDGLLLKSDNSTTVDSAADQSTIIEWADIPLPGLEGSPLAEARIYRVHFQYIDRGASTWTVTLSTDGGLTYPHSASLSIGGGTVGTLSYATADLIATGRQFRIKLTDSTDTDLELVRAVLEWEPEGSLR